MSWPLIRTDRSAAASLTIVDALFGALIAWAVPIAVGGVLLVVDILLFRDGDTATVLTGVSVMLLYSAMLSWLGLIPGALLLLSLIRLGWGGFGAAVVIGFLLGWGISIILGAPSPVSLFTIFGVILSAVTWVALKRRRPHALVAG